VSKVLRAKLPVRRNTILGNAFFCDNSPKTASFSMFEKQDFIVDS
jgi:hypothetical protein